MSMNKESLLDMQVYIDIYISKDHMEMGGAKAQKVEGGCNVNIKLMVAGLYLGG